MFYLLPSKATFECVAVLVRWTRTAESMLRRAAQARARATMPHSLSPKQARGRHREPGPYAEARQTRPTAPDYPGVRSIAFSLRQCATSNGWRLRPYRRSGWKMHSKIGPRTTRLGSVVPPALFFGRCCCFGACRLPAECRVRFWLVGQYLGVFICVCMCVRLRVYGGFREHTSGVYELDRKIGVPQKLTIFISFGTRG